jgi:hypothetical protein
MNDKPQRRMLTRDLARISYPLERFYPAELNWLAWWADEKDHHHMGFGRTEEEAIADLQRLDRERAESPGGE